jgi:rhodanese-related sulfurtransferase
MAHRDLTPPDTKQLLDSGEGWILVDVRTPEEFDQGHPAGSYHVPFGVRDAMGQMVPNADFAATIKRHFQPDAKLIFT